MQTDWYIAVNSNNEVLSTITNRRGHSLLTWESRVGTKPMPVILWPDCELPSDVNWKWPEDVTMIHLDRL